MAPCNNINVNLSNLKLYKLKSATKNSTGVTLELSSDISCNSNVKTNFPHKLLLSDEQVARLY